MKKLVDMPTSNFFCSASSRRCASARATRVALIRLRLVSTARARLVDGGTLLALVWPHLREIEQSRPYTARVVELLRALGVEVIDLAEHLAGRDAAELIVGPLDNHPGPELHAEVAELLRQHIMR